MPHVIIKLWSGRSEEVKQSLAEQIAKDVSEGLKVDQDHVSVAFEEVGKADWCEQVYQPDMGDKGDQLYVKPNYEYES